MVWKTILLILVINIFLPTLDTVADIKLVYNLFRGAHYCDDRYRTHPDYSYDYQQCTTDPENFCEGRNGVVCRFDWHPKMAAAMLTPFLLNYFVCFITFFRKVKNKKYTFIFPLLNIYPQFGKNNH